MRRLQAYRFRIKPTAASSCHNKWFRAQVQESLDDPRPGIPHAEVKAEWAKERAGLLKLAGETK